MGLKAVKGSEKNDVFRDRPRAHTKFETLHGIHFPRCLQAVYKSNSYLLIWNPQSLSFS